MSDVTNNKLNEIGHLHSIVDGIAMHWRMTREAAEEARLGDQFEYLVRNLGNVPEIKAAATEFGVDVTLFQSWAAVCVDCWRRAGKLRKDDYERIASAWDAGAGAVFRDLQRKVNALFFELWELPGIRAAAKRQAEDDELRQYQLRMARAAAAAEADAAKPAAGDAKAGQAESLGYLSPTEIATAIDAGEKADAIRKYLKRLLDGGALPGGAWMENSDPAKGQARILYKLSAVRPFLARFVAGESG